MKREIVINRRQEAFKEHVSGSITVLFAGDLVKRSADSTYPFIVNRNFYYLTQCDEDGLIYVQLRNAVGNKEILFIKDHNPVLEKWVGKSLTKDEAIHKSGVFMIQPLSQFESFFARTLSRNDIQTLYIDSERDQLTHRNSEAETFVHRIQRLYPGLHILNINQKLNKMRTIKSNAEVELIKEAIDVTRLGIEALVSKLQPGRFEYQAVADFKYELNLKHCDVSFDTIAASGKDATVLHYVSNHKEMKDGDLLLLDCGAAFKHYCGDISRTFPVNGKFTDRQREAYEIVLEAQNEVIKAIKPGVSLIQLNEIVRNVYKERCVQAKMIEAPEHVDEVYYHSVSHSVGLDTHDVGMFEGAVLEPGMVITVEPGLYLEHEGIGIRIEDDVLVTETGCENLSSSILKTVEEIETFMNLSK